MIGDNAKRVIIESTPKKVFAKHALVSLKEVPLKKGDNPISNPSCIFTSGEYTIKYKPGVPGFEKKPYVIRCDLFSTNKLRIKNIKDLKEMGKTDMRARFLARNTNLKAEMLKIAKNHVEMPIAFSLDIIKYRDNLKKNGEITKTFLWEVE